VSKTEHYFRHIWRLLFSGKWHCISC